MKLNKSLLHGSTSFLAFLLSLFVIYASAMNFIEGRPELGMYRLPCGVILLLYSGINLFLSFKVEVSKALVAVFPFAFLFFGLYWDYHFRGFIKGWAPANPEEALTQSIMGFGILVFLSIFGLIPLWRQKVLDEIHNKRQHIAPSALDSQQVARLCGGR